MNDTILAALISAFAAIVVCVINGFIQNRKIISELDKHNDLQAYKIDELTKHVEKHNKVIERVYILEKEDEVEKGLTSLGIKKLWKGNSFKNISETLALDEFGIIQKNKISIDENGIEAASATLSYGIAGVTELEEIDVVLDKPFMYIVMCDGIPLFIGTVYNPTE